MEKKKKQIPLVLQPTTYKIVIPEEVENAIRLLCSEVSEIEWSGILFYDYSGSFETKDLTITCRDICVMDIGVSTYTEFVESPDVITYQMEHDLLDCKTGLIHSHNKMQTFFSGTDTATLLDEGLSMNNFVSLIVNNEGTYSAAITRRVKVIKDIRESLTYKFFGETEPKESSRQYYDDDERVEYFKLNIVKKEGINNAILFRLKEILKNKRNPFQGITSSQKHLPFPPNPVKEIKLTKGKKVKQPKFFDDDFEDIHYDKDIIPEEDIINTALQIITGSILCTKDGKLNIDTWVKKMDNLFVARFPDNQNFLYWASNNIDSVLSTFDIPSLKYGQDINQGLMAEAIIDFLSKYQGKSKHLDTMISLIEKYTL